MLPTHDELLEAANGWLACADNTHDYDRVIAYATMALAATGLAREIRKRPPDAWQVWADWKEPELPVGFNAAGPWEPFATTAEGELLTRRPLRKVVP